MAASDLRNAKNIGKPPPKPKPKQVVCFSFAAYAKSLISHLRSSGVPVVAGLSDVEFSSVESLLGFTFPPDLRAILREGLPVGTGFPNWRSSSPQHLRVLLNLPVLSLLKQVSHRRFWTDSWGLRPDDIDLALELAGNSLRKSPILVPIFKNCYIPCSPNESGNPVFQVNAEDVTITSFDITGFFRDFFEQLKSLTSRQNGVVPVWTAKKTARRIEFWTEAAERLLLTAARGAWWSGEVGACLDEVFWRLREGGWKEEEVREMLMMKSKKNMDGWDRVDPTAEEEKAKKGVTWHVGMLSLVLLRAGWNTEDVVYSLDLQNDDEKDAVVFDGKSGTWCSRLRRIHMQSLEV